MVVAVLVALAACAVVAKVDNIIHEVRFAEVYRCAPAELPAPNAAPPFDPDATPSLCSLPHPACSALGVQRQPNSIL